MINSSKWLTDFTEKIFDTNDQNFSAKAIELFQYHHLENGIYRKYCDLLQVQPASIKQIKDIPFLPISFFKSHRLILDDNSVETVFESSGTTGNVTSKHFVQDVSIYSKSFIKCFEKFYGEVENHHILALLPSYLEREGSSLIKMVSELIEKSNSSYSNFFLNNTAEFNTILNQLNAQKQKVLVIGVSYALLDFIEQFKTVPNPNMIVMETGGMKGRRKEMIREELHLLLRNGFQSSSIHSEYGMTELLSQAYSKSNGIFQTPAWMKVLIRRQDDPFSYCDFEETGAINIIDFANIYSCPFIQTDDLGKVYSNGQFEVLGRFDSSDVRGCNLMVN